MLDKAGMISWRPCHTARKNGGSTTWLKHVCEEHTAASISEETHGYVWEIAKRGETSPMYAVFATRLREPNAEELAWARRELESA